ncbi:hypothetical protein CVT24_004589 [Panaeolus cyanescens]|uniref:AMP-dependent synthetase/ligase domain-containing protein n=1 Tax=Panaeolus cyanescens TaxID=181874 RepID=A0A409YBE2_9AGAR|nr:hypothetical protein CVT24_004589 [Panaeolus cyanescens]
MLNHHLTVLESSSVKFANKSVYQIPQLDSTGRLQSWRSISYSQFKHDVELYARHFTRLFEKDRIPKRSVIGTWISGFTYADVLHIYGLSRAGYTPQLFSIRLPNPIVIYELLRKANAKAIIYDSSFEQVLGNCPVPKYRFNPSESVASVDATLPNIYEFRGSDLAFLFHTSGSTSGSPKLVPVSFNWLNSVVVKSQHISRPRNPERQDVTVYMGSMCHIGQSFMLIGSMQYGSCTIQPTTIGFSSEELIEMIHRAGLNRLNQFAAFLMNHFRNARQDPKLLSMLTQLDDVLYSGMPVPYEEEKWALASGIKLRNLFGSTEVGGMLLSGEYERNAALLRPLPGTSYSFIPIESNTDAVQSTAALYELVILADSPDCPDKSLRSADGHFHTGDLFQQVVSGWYVSRGRDDDWIKSENSLRCDTKAIEDTTRTQCGHLIAECIVVGTGRPSPVMFIEPATDMDHAKLKKEIIRRTRQFHSRRYLHERITSPDMIVIVPPKTLPRTATKGNIRRKAVEEAYKTEIDRIFGR